MSALWFDSKETSFLQEKNYLVLFQIHKRGKSSLSGDASARSRYFKLGDYLTGYSNRKGWK